MQDVSSVYVAVRQSNDYYVETALIICDNSIPLASDYEDSEHSTLNHNYVHNEEELWSISTSRNAFSNNTPEAGCCTCGEIDVQMIKPRDTIPQMARITPYVRLVPNDAGDNWVVESTIKAATVTSTSAYTGYCYFVGSKRFEAGTYLTVEFDFTISGVTTSNARIFTYYCGSSVADYQYVTDTNSGHHTATFAVTAAQASATQRMRFRITNANAGAEFTVTNVRLEPKTSEWIRKGVYFIDSRNVTKNDDNLNILTLHGYDAMLKADVDCEEWDDGSVLDKVAVQTIAAEIGVEVDQRTINTTTPANGIINNNYEVVAPIGYSMREVLGQVASAYGGNFIINDVGKLQLIVLWNLPQETNLLTDEDYSIITFGVGDNLTRIDLGEED